MTVVVQEEFFGINYDLEHPRLCWDREAGTATATTEAAGFSASFANSVRLDNFWQPTAVPATWTLTLDADAEVSYLGIAAHNLAAQAATVKVEYKLGAGSWTEIDFGGDHEPADNDPILFLFGAIEMSAIRVTIVTADAAPTIGVIGAGAVDEWPRKAVWTGTPITEGDNLSFTNNSSDTGVMLGRTLTSDGLSFQVTVNNLPEDWRRAGFKAFKAYANKGQSLFFIATRPAYYPDEVAFAWSSETVMMSRETPNRRLSGTVNLNLMAYRQDFG